MAVVKSPDAAVKSQRDRYRGEFLQAMNSAPSRDVWRREHILTP